jgi:putative copper export protein
MEIMDILNVGMRWLHISSMAIIVGGLFFLWLGFDETNSTAERAAAAYRPIFLLSAAIVLISGIYNFLRKTGLTPTYHAVIGVKFLLVLHVLVAGFLATRAANPKRRRQAAGAAITGFVILLLSAVLRRLTT